MKNLVRIKSSLDTLEAKRGDVKMNIIFDKKMKNYKEIKGFSQNGYIRIVYINKLSEIAMMGKRIKILRFVMKIIGKGVEHE